MTSEMAWKFFTCYTRRQIVHVILFTRDEKNRGILAYRQKSNLEKYAMHSDRYQDTERCVGGGNETNGKKSIKIRCIV